MLPPNILFFLADDMGYGDPGYLAVGNKHGKLLTPNMDQMVADGMSFTEAYAGAPVCAPSRCTLITGRHSGHCSVRNNGPSLGVNDVGFAEVLRSNGYHTRHIGKWGLGDWVVPGSSPLDKGFEYYYGQMNQGYCHNYYPSYMDFGEILPNGTHSTSEITIPANINASEKNCGPDRLKCMWSGDLWTNETRTFLASPEASSATTPWMLYLSYTAPHAGGVGTNSEGQPPVPRISTGPYEKHAKDLGHEIGYASAVTEMDRQLGLVLTALNEAKLEEKTVVFFASDNGASNEGGQHSYMTFASSGPLKGYKRSLHEGGHRSALIVQWKGTIFSGSKSKQQFAFYDFFATALDIAGLDPSTHLPKESRDGDSLLPTLLGRSGVKQKAFIYHECVFLSLSLFKDSLFLQILLLPSQFHHLTPLSHSHRYCQPTEVKSGWGQALRVGDWSSVCVGHFKAPTFAWPVCNETSIMIYDLASDVGQTNNVAASNPDVVKSMMAQLKTVRFRGDYCGEPAGPTLAPTPSPFPLDPGTFTGTWTQGKGKGEAIDVTVDSVSLTFTAKAVDCCSWDTAKGRVSKDGVTITVLATGPNGFKTGQIGNVVATPYPDGTLTIAWTHERGVGVQKSWADWSFNRTM